MKKKAVILCSLSLLVSVPTMGMANTSHPAVMDKSYVAFSTENEELYGSFFRNVEVSASSAKPGDVITIKGRLREEVTNVESVSAYLYTSGQGNRWISLSFDESTGYWIGEYEVSKYDPEGEWDVQLEGFSDDENYFYSGVVENFTIINPDSEFDAPVLEDFQISSAQAGLNETVTFSAKVSDHSEILNTTLFLEGDEGNGESIELTYDKEKERWTGSYTVEISDRPGAYSLAIGAEDIYGNYMWEYAYGKFTVLNPEGDFTAPEVTNIKMNPENVKAGEKIKIVADVQDDKSGVKDVYGWLATSHQSESHLEFLYDPSLEKWVAEYLVKQNDLTGEWILNLNVTDKAGNHGYSESAYTIQVEGSIEDSDPPKLIDLEISQTTAAAGEEIVFSAAVEDTTTDVDSVDIILEDENGYSNYIRLQYSEENGRWEARYEVSPMDITGLKTVRVAMRDSFGNYTEVDGGQTLEFKKDSEQTSWFESFSFDKTTLEVGEEITFKAKVLEGVEPEYLSAKLESEFGERYANRYVDFTYNEDQHEWIGTYTIQPNDLHGEWSIQVEGTKANGQYFYQDQDQTFFVNNESGDFDGPELQGFDISPRVVSPGETVTITADFEDAVSGVDRVEAHLMKPGGNGEVFELTYDSGNDYWVCEYQVGKYAEDGIWQLELNGIDAAGNNEWFTQLGQDSTFKVNNPNYTGPDEDGPVLGNYYLNQDAFNVGEKVKVHAEISDELSGVSNATAALYDTHGNYFEVLLELEESSGLWVGEYEITSASRPGEWSFSEIYANDEFGNYVYETFNQPFSVINEDYEYITNGPKIGEVTVSSESVRTGETITIEAKVNDSDGVRNVYGFLSGDRDSEEIGFEYDAAKDVWVAEFKAEDYHYPGEWSLELYALDEDWNETFKEIDQFVNLINDSNDFIGPEVKVTSSHTKANVGDEITITVDADDSDGVKSIDGYMLAGRFQEHYIELDFNYDGKTNKWIAKHVIQANDRDGSWNLYLIANDNRLNHTENQFADFLTIENPNGDYSGPTIRNAEVSSDSLTAGDTLSFSAEINDHQSEVKIANAYLFGPNTFKKIPLVFNQETGRWAGAYTIKETDYAGEYDLSFEALDEAGNYSDYWFKQVTFDVENPDTVEPKLLDFTMDKESVKQGEAVTFTATASDDRSGVTGISMHMENMYMAIEKEFVFDETSKKWILEFLAEEAPVYLGEFNLSIAVHDDAGNTSFTPLEQMLSIVKAEDETIESPSYNDAAWYYEQNNYYNAVHFAGKALKDGDKRSASILHGASEALLNATVEMSAMEAEEAYTLLVSTNGVPEAIKKAAQAHLNPAVESPSFGDAEWYASKGNHFNAVYYAGKALKDGDIRAESIMKSSAKALLEEASAMTAEKAKEIYDLLANTNGVPADVKTAAEQKLTPAVESPSYGEAEWYLGKGNHFNAVYYAGKALKDGDTRAEIIMNNAAQELLKKAADMNPAEAEDVYTLLVSTSGVPADIKAEAEEKLIPAVESPSYGVAEWYLSQENHYNAVFFAAKALADGDTRAESVMKKSAEGLFAKAADMNANDSQNAYTLLATTKGVPSEIKDASEAKLSPAVESPSYGEAAWYLNSGNYYNAVHFAGKALKDGDTRTEEIMLQAASELLNRASGMNQSDAMNAYDLLVNTFGVPADIKEKAAGRM